MLTVFLTVLFNQDVEPVVVAVTIGMEVADVLTVVCVNPTGGLTDWLSAASADVELFHILPPFWGAVAPVSRLPCVLPPLPAVAGDIDHPLLDVQTYPINDLVELLCCCGIAYYLAGESECCGIEQPPCVLLFIGKFLE